MRRANVDQSLDLVLVNSNEKVAIDVLDLNLVAIQKLQKSLHGVSRNIFDG